MRYLLLSTTLFIHCLCEAQVFDENNFVRYTKLDGLSNNFIIDIAQDSSGYIWIGTKKGLNRFDGKFFTNYFKNSESSPIPENLMISLALQNKNELIGTTATGAFSYNTVSHHRVQFIVPADSIIHFWSNQSWQALKDQNGNYVVSTKTGLYVFNRGGKIICRYDHYKPSDVGEKELWFGNWLCRLSNGTIFQDNNLSGSLYRPDINKIDTFYGNKTKKINWLSPWKSGDERISFHGSGDELFLPNPRSSSMDVYNLLTASYSSHAVPPSFLADLDWYSKLFYINDSLLAITSKIGGFYLLDYFPAHHKLLCDGRKYFTSKYCTSIFKDQEGRFWIGTNDGLYKENIRNPFFDVQDLSAQYPDVLNTGIQSVYIAKGKTLIGLGNEGGLLVLDNKTRKIERHISFRRFGTGSNSINFILGYQGDTLWIGTGKGILWLNSNTYSNGKLIIRGQPGWMVGSKTRNYLKDSQGDIWLSFGELNSLVVFNRKEQRIYDLSNSPNLRITFCFSMVEDKNKNVWIAGDGLCRWNRKKNAIDTLIPFPRASRSIFNYMQIFDCDEDNNLWFASYDNEVLQYNCNTNRMFLRLPENSMIDGYTVTNSSIIKGQIWLGMVNGISAFNIKDHSVKQFNYSDGLPSAVVTSHRKGSFYDEQANRFYFGAGYYLISFVPDINLSARPVPQFSIEATTGNKMLSQEIKLPFSQNEVELRFNVINFTDPEENRFAYRFINEVDSTWRELNAKNVLILSKLSPGSHEIEVQLFSVNNRWPPQFKRVNIRITPPFWETSWFLILTGAFLSALIYFVYRRRIHQIQQRANLDNLLAQTEMKALHSQMNPHFIFNCLNSIREMILNSENRQASHYLSKFAQLIRITLDNSTKPFVSLKESIDYLKRYLEMEKIRTNHFSYLFEIDEELEPEETFIPPMLIQPFIENAIWHGQDPGKPMNLVIRFERKNNELICIVDDNGIGIENSLRNKQDLNHHSVGIANIRQRIQVLNEKYRLSSSVVIEDKSKLSPGNENGTKITLHLPVKNVEKW
jgi:ligand-binding sensor domain-containing protein